MAVKKVTLAIVGLVVFGVGAASAAPGGTNPTPPAACDALHGAFGYFDPENLRTLGNPPYFGDEELGSARAGVTGDVNSSYSASCNG